MNPTLFMRVASDGRTTNRRGCDERSMALHATHADASLEPPSEVVADGSNLCTSQLV